MRALATIFVAFLIASACSPKKTETTSGIDSLAVDSVVASSPAASALAFSSLEQLGVKNATDLPDSINYFHLSSQEELEQKFDRSGEVDASNAPDFIINYILAIATGLDLRGTTISLDKVVTNENSIDVFVNIYHTEAGHTMLVEAQLFAIERREGYPVMQFYVNGKKDKALVLVENQ
jgi:hypothetical protein